MTSNQLKKLTFSDMREMVSGMRTTQSNMFYISKDFGIGMGKTDLFRKVLQPNMPFLADDNRFGLLKKGEIDVTVNLIRYKLMPGTVAYIGRGSIVQVNHVSEDVDMSGMILGDGFFKLSLDGRLPRSFSGQELHFYQQVSQEDADIISRILQTIWAVVHQTGYNEETVHGLVAAIAHFYDGLRRRATETKDARHTRERDIFERFIMLVNANCNKHRSLSYYAGLLYLSERYLGTVVRKASGSTAKEWIDRAVETNVKVMLRHSDLQVSQISDRLNFANDSFFCKYFRRLTGMTPGEYRKKQINQA